MNSCHVFRIERLYGNEAEIPKDVHWAVQPHREFPGDVGFMGTNGVIDEDGHISPEQIEMMEDAITPLVACRAVDQQQIIGFRQSLAKDLNIVPSGEFSFGRGKRRMNVGRALTMRDPCVFVLNGKHGVALDQRGRPVPASKFEHGSAFRDQPFDGRQHATVNRPMLAAHARQDGRGLHEGFHGIGFGGFRLILRFSAVGPSASQRLAQAPVQVLEPILARPQRPRVGPPRPAPSPAQPPVLVRG